MSRIELGAKPVLTPMPVLIIGTYDENGKPNAMNAAWGMVSDYEEVSISLGKHKTTENFAKTGAFTVSMGTEDTVIACDYVGVVSGSKVPDKFEKAGFTAIRSEHVNAPIIAELPLTIECTVKSFENGILVGQIVNVLADESVLTDGAVDMTKVKPIIYDSFNNAYIGYGQKVGNAFKDGLQIK